MHNAANNIDAKSKSLKDILFERHYKVGYFQREYKWKRNNVEDLLVDLERSFNANWEESHVQKDVANYDKYYMGPIVLFLDDSEYSIVDGQQRLTSFILIMIFLNHKYKEILKSSKKFSGYIFSEHYGEESYNMNIEERDKMLDHLYKGEIVEEANLKNESSKNILERYNDIVELFPPFLLQEKVFPLFANWITEKLVFIEILTQTSESAYTIFETMNDRGLNLTQTELLKSFLLSNVKDDSKIKELDLLWKNKISVLNSIDEDQDFFKAWLRAKYAITIRTTEKDSENKDFEKIGTRFSSWTQENVKIKESSTSKLLLDVKDANSFYFFVKSDFTFFSDLYIQLKNMEFDFNTPEPKIKLLSFRGVSDSLSYPLILSPVQKTDSEELVEQKTETVINYLDAFGIYRMLLSETINQSSIRNAIYVKIKDIRNNDLETLISKLSSEISVYKDRYLKEDYTLFDSNSKYILSRIYSNKNPKIEFENIYLQRRKDSYTLYQFLKTDDFETEKLGLPKGLKDRIVVSLCSYTIVPKQIVNELNNLDILKRIERLLAKHLLVGYSIDNGYNNSNLRDFFIKREKALKEAIITIWKV